MSKHIACTLAALTALAVGCTGSSSSDGGTGTTSSTTGTTSGTTGGTGDAGFGIGVVNVVQQILDDGSGGTQITVLATADLSLQVASEGCTHRDMPPSCTIIVCPSALPDGGVVAEAPATNAGTITISTSDSAAAPGPIEIVPIDGGYSKAVLGTEFFESGDTITFVAGGGPVPAFQGTVTAPSPISLIPPNVDGGPIIDRANDFSIDWDVVGPPNGQVQLTVANGLTSARCVFDASAGTGTIPAAVLQQVPAGAGSLTGTSLGQVTVPAGDSGSVVLDVISIGDNFVQVGLE
ncbi:MAG: hypothetical protein JST54_33945 [Deltaproteobacteria bacterium]|nr:hypothetical protein [Deltaproteobacteria bacterium]